MQHSDNFPHGSWCECTWMPASVAELEETTTNPEHQSAKNYKELLKIENLTKGHAWLRWRSCIQIAWFNKFSYRTKSWDFQYEKKQGSHIWEKQRWWCTLRFTLVGLMFTVPLRWAEWTCRRRSVSISRHSGVTTSCSSQKPQIIFICLGSTVMMEE